MLVCQCLSIVALNCNKLFYLPKEETSITQYCNANLTMNHTYLRHAKCFNVRIYICICIHSEFDR